MGNVRVIEIKESVFADNDATSKAIREKMSAQRTLFLNVMSGPGSGKTTFLTTLINRLKDQMKIGEMDVDIETSLDAQRVADLTGSIIADCAILMQIWYPVHYLNMIQRTLIC